MICINGQPSADASEVSESDPYETAVSTFLKQASPFSNLGPAALQRLSERLSPLSVNAGTDIVREGDSGDECYLLLAGSVEVVTGRGESERRLTVLGKGAIFGEMALMADTVRTATIRTLEKSDLLMLRRPDLIDAVGSDRDTAARLIDLVQLRNRPLQVEGILAQKAETDDGSQIIVLKDPARGAYYRLSPEGWFIWQRLDGNHTLKDLTMEYFSTFGSISPQAIADVITGLNAAGFIEKRQFRRDMLGGFFQPSLWQKTVKLVRRLLQWWITWNNTDGAATRMFRIVSPLYTRPGLFILAATALAGLIAFFFQGGTDPATILRFRPDGAMLISLEIAYLFAIIIHEAGHAFTTKAFGREVPSVGIGWYWFGPCAFINTSDMWLAKKWPRIAVSLAGMYSNIILAGIASLAGLAAENTELKMTLLHFALVNYIFAVLNLTPLLEFDGYYVLTDLLDRPNLRSESFSWIKKDLLRSIKSPASLWGHRVELLYGAGSICFTFLMLAAMVFFVSFMFKKGRIV